MKTKAGDIAVGDFVLWAVPNFSLTALEEIDNSRPMFQYKIYHSYEKPWCDGCVKIAEVKLTASIPPGLDLLGLCVEGLEEEKRKLVQKYKEEMDELNLKLSHVRLLTGPTSDFIPAERPASKFDDEIPY